MPRRARGTWTDEKRKRAIALAKAGETNDVIAGMIGMSSQAVWTVTRGVRAEKCAKPRKPAERVQVCRVHESVHVPSSAETERAARQLARDLRDSAARKRGDVTAEFFGDPPPGYSALDRKRA